MSFAGLSVFPQLTKKYIPLVSLGTHLSEDRKRSSNRILKDTVLTVFDQLIV